MKSSIYEKVRELGLKVARKMERDNSNKIEFEIQLKSISGSIRHITQIVLIKDSTEIITKDVLSTIIFINIILEYIQLDKCIMESDIEKLQQLHKEYK